MHRQQMCSRLVVTEAVRHSAQPHRSRHWVEVLVPLLMRSEPVAQEWPLVVAAPSPRVSTRAISRVALAQLQTVDHRISMGCPTPLVAVAVREDVREEMVPAEQDPDRRGRLVPVEWELRVISQGRTSTTAVVGAAPRMAPGRIRPTGMTPSPSLPGRGDRVVVAPGGE